MALYRLPVLLLVFVHLEPRCVTRIYVKKINRISLVHEPDALDCIFVIALPPLLPLNSQGIL